MLGNQKLSSVLREFKPDISNHFKDTYVLEFLNLPVPHSENDLQKALIKEMKTFILELGKDFIFVGKSSESRLGIVISK